MIYCHNVHLAALHVSKMIAPGSDECGAPPNRSVIRCWFFSHDYWSSKGQQYYVLALCVYCVAVWGPASFNNNTWDAGLFIVLHACTGQDRCCHYITVITCAEYIGGAQSALWHRGSRIASQSLQHWPSPYYLTGLCIDRLTPRSCLLANFFVQCEQ